MKRIATILMLFTLITSCKKEGCTDVKATNFDTEAKNENGTCIYKSNMTFWFDQETSDWLIGLGSYKLFIEVGGKVELELLVAEFDLTTPDCESSDNIFKRIQMDLGKNNYNTYPLRVTDDLDNVLWVKESLYFFGGECNNYELIH